RPRFAGRRLVLAPGCLHELPHRRLPGRWQGGPGGSDGRRRRDEHHPAIGTLDRLTEQVFRNAQFVLAGGTNNDSDAHAASPVRADRTTLSAYGPGRPAARQAVMWRIGEIRFAFPPGAPV